MKTRRLFWGDLILLFSIILDNEVIKLFPKYANVSVVFFKPGKTLFPQTRSTKTEPLPLLPDNQISNIILFIADSMGLKHLNAARSHFLGSDARLHVVKKSEGITV